MPSSRIVELPYVYDADCVPPTKRTALRRHVRASAAFAVTAASHEEAPVAIRVVRNQDFREYANEDRPAHGRSPLETMRKAQGLEPRKPRVRTAPDVYESRLWEGRLFEAVGERRGERVKLDSFLHDVGLGRSHFHSFARTGPEGGIEARDLPVLPVLPVLEDAGFDRDTPFSYVDLDATLRWVASSQGRHTGTKVKWHDATARKDEAQLRYARDLLFLDDEAWVSKAGLEPYWTVASDDGRRTVELEVSWRPFPSARHSPFRADRRDDAVAFARAMADRLAYDLVETSDEIHVLMPEALRNDDVVMLARAVASTAGPSSFAERTGWPPEVSRALVDVRALKDDALLGRFAAGDLEWAVAVLSAAERAMASNVDPETNDFVKAISFAMTRWTEFEREMRPEVATAALDAVDETEMVLGF